MRQRVWNPFLNAAIQTYIDIYIGIYCVASVTTPGAGPVRHVFSDLQFSFLLPPKHFVVLAPAHIGVLNTSLGSCFLTQQHHVPRRETVLLLVPLATQ